MRTISPGGDSARIAAGTVAARVPMIPLIVSAHDWQVLDANVGMFSTRYVVQNSCAGLYPRYEAFGKREANAWFAAQSPGRRLVGLGTACLGTGGECRVDGFSHGNYLGAWEALMQAAITWGVARGATLGRVTVPAEDESKRASLASLGFREAASREQFDLDGRKAPSVRLEKALCRDAL